MYLNNTELTPTTSVFGIVRNVIICKFSHSRLQYTTYNIWGMSAAFGCEFFQILNCHEQGKSVRCYGCFSNVLRDKIVFWNIIHLISFMWSCFVMEMSHDGFWAEMHLIGIWNYNNFQYSGKGGWIAFTVAWARHYGTK